MCPSYDNLKSDAEDEKLGELIGEAPSLQEWNKWCNWCLREAPYLTMMEEDLYLCESCEDDYAKIEANKLAQKKDDADNLKVDIARDKDYFGETSREREDD